MRLRARGQLAQLSRKRRRDILNFRRDADRYLIDVLAPEANLTAIELLEPHYKRLKYRARRGDGTPVFIKFYRGREAATAARGLALAARFAERGLHVPETSRTDLSAETLDRYGLACICRRWIERGPEDNPATAEAALADLGRLHHAMAANADEAADERLPAIEPPRLEATGAMEEVRRIVAELDECHFAIPTADAGRVARYFERAFQHTDLAQAEPRWVLTDYDPQNVILDAEDCLWHLDIEEAAPGLGGLGLALALLGFGYGRESEALTEAPLGALAGGGRLPKLIEGYDQTAPAGERDRWNRHGESFLLWAYLGTIGQLAKRSTNAIRYARPRRRHCARHARLRWRRLAAFIQGGPGRPIE